MDQFRASVLFALLLSSIPRFPTLLNPLNTWSFPPSHPMDAAGSLSPLSRTDKKGRTG